MSHLSADAVFALQAGRALCEQLIAENDAAMRELADERAMRASLRDQIERVQLDAVDANRRATVYHKAMLDLYARCNALAADVARHSKRPAAEDVEALRIMARAHGIPLPEKAKA